MNHAAQEILIFDRALCRKRRERIAPNFEAHDFLFSCIADKLTDRLQDVRRDFYLALQIGSRGAISQEKFKNKIKSLITLDSTCRPLTPCPLYIQAEEDFLPIKQQSADLIISNMNLHSVNDLPGALLQIRQALKPDGLFLATMLGGETLFELRDILTQTEMDLFGGISPRVFPFADKPQAGNLLQRAGFALPVVDSEIICVTYDNMFKLLHDLRHMGESNIIGTRQKTNPGKGFFMEAAKRYHETYGDNDGRLHVTFEVIFLIGWAPHVSQQQPLKPGSAQFRLADALGTREVNAGEGAEP